MLNLFCWFWRRMRELRDEHRDRGHNYEWERAKQSLRHIVLFLLVSVGLALFLNGDWSR